MTLTEFHAQPLRDRERLNRDVVRPFYEQEEDYDWTDAADHFRGLETFMHRLREGAIRRSLRRYAKPGPMLDVGCGSGLMLRHLPAGSIGIDLNPRNVERARRYAPTADVRLGDAEHLTFANGAFSTAIITEVLEHLVFAEQAVTELRRVLRPGGILIGSVPRISFIWRLRRLSSTCPANEPFHHEMTRDELLGLLAPFPYTLVWPAPWLLQYFFLASDQPL